MVGYVWHVWYAVCTECAVYGYAQYVRCTLCTVCAVPTFALYVLSVLYYAQCGGNFKLSCFIFEYNSGASMINIFKPMESTTSYQTHPKEKSINVNETFHQNGL